MNLNGLFQSKRFWATVGTLAFVVLQDRFELGLTEEQIQNIALAIGAWIVGDSLRSTVPKA